MKIGFEVKKLHMLISGELRSSTSIKAMDDMTNTHGYILKYLASNDDRETFQRDIEKEFMISRATASEVLKLMEKNGLIERRSVERDARLKRILLTEKGKRLNEQVRREFDEFDDMLKSLLTDEEMEQFVNIVNKLSEGLKRRKEVL